MVFEKNFHLEHVRCMNLTLQGLSEVRLYHNLLIALGADVMYHGIFNILQDILLEFQYEIDLLLMQ